ncbi:MAG: hypothetical protein HQK50_09325 [Oligoflexia bacterium]|nr:hypothetical protein [Oligoflexia bacterium]
MLVLSDLEKATLEEISNKEVGRPIRSIGYDPKLNVGLLKTPKGYLEFPSIPRLVKVTPDKIEERWVARIEGGLGNVYDIIFPVDHGDSVYIDLNNVPRNEAFVIVLTSIGGGTFITEDKDFSIWSVVDYAYSDGAKKKTFYSILRIDNDVHVLAIDNLRKV